MKLKQSIDTPVLDDEYKISRPADFYHGFHRQRKNKNLNERYFYLLDFDYGWKFFDYLSNEDKELYLNGNSDKVNWRKYKDEHSKMNDNFSKRWKDFYTLHNDIISKYKTSGCAIMLGSHFTEGRSNGYFIINSDEELEQLLEDMKSIGINVSDL